MTLRATALFLAVLFSMSASSLHAHTPQQPRTPPVLRSGGTYSPGQRQNAPNNDPIGPGEVDEGSVVRVSTSLITVLAVVMDRNGRYIGNLRKEDFQVFEDGVEQTVLSPTP